VWTLRGVRPLIPAVGSNQRLCIYGALNYRSGQSHYMVHPKKNAQQFTEFLRQLLEANSERRLVLVLDNAGYHCTRAVRCLLEDHADHVFVIWLPRYSPELNLIEGLWGYMKRSALNNYFYGDVESLESAVHEAFTNIQQHPETALSLAYKTSTNLRQTA
jgi:putative transposase